MERLSGAVFALAVAGLFAAASLNSVVFLSVPAGAEGWLPIDTPAAPGPAPDADSIFYSTDFESGAVGWEADGLWHAVSYGADAYNNSHSPVTSWWYGVDATGNYNNGTRNWGALASPYLALPPTGILTLSWWEWQRMDDYPGTDLRTVRVLDGAESYVLSTMDNRDGVAVWTQHSADLTPFRGRTVRVAFDFDSVDAFYNNLRGWYVDDVAIASETVAETVPPVFKGVWRAYDSGDGGIVLEWNASHDFALSYPITYEIYRATSSGAEDLIWPTATYTSFDLPGDLVVWVDRDVKYDAEYYYVVRARDACWNRDSNTKEAHARCLDVSPPSFAGLLSATDTGSMSIRLVWNAATDPQGSAPIAYSIYRATSSGAQDFGSPLAVFTPAPGSPVEWVNTGVAPSVVYYYVVRAEDRFGNQEGNTVELPALAQFRWWMQTEAPGIPGFLNLTAEPLGDGTEAAVGPLLVPGEYSVGGVSWLSRPMDDAYETQGVWRFRATGRMTTPNAHGRLYAGVSIVGANGTRPLFTTAPDDEDVARFPSDHVFEWMHDAPADDLLPGERVAVELWLSVSSTVSGNDAVDIPNSGFDTGSQNWTYYDISGNKFNFDYWGATGGNPGGWAGVEFEGPRNGKSIAECGGLQTCEFYYDNTSFRPVLRFDYSCLDFQTVEICMLFEAFISRVDGNTTVGPQVFFHWSNSVFPWTDSGAIPLDAYLNESGTYYLKLGVWANGLGKRAHALGGFDNVRITWENLTTLFVLTFDSTIATTDVLPALRLAGKPPVADAGDDIAGPVNLTARLSATGTSETDGDAVNYTWTFRYEGADIVRYGIAPEFTFAVPGAYLVNMTASDEDGWSADSLVVTAYNTPPVADAGLPMAVPPGTTAVLYGDGSYDVDGHELAYLWTFTYDSILYELCEACPSFLFIIEGNYTLTLTVSDWWGGTSTDSTWIVVANSPPVADAGPDFAGVAPLACEFDGAGSYDPDGHAVNLTWTFTYDGAGIVLFGASPSFTFAVVGNYTVTLAVSDGYGGTAYDSLLVTAAAQLPPVADAGADVSVNQHETVQFDGSGSFDAGGIAGYAWSFEYAGAPVALAGPAPVFVFDDAGTYAVTLTVADGAGLTDQDEMTVTVNDTTPPVAAFQPDQHLAPGDTAVLNASGSHDNVGIVRCEWAFDHLGAWTVLNGSSQSFVFTVPGAYYVTMTVADASGNTASTGFNVFVVDSVPPVAEAGGDIDVLEHESVSFNASASHDDSGIANYTWAFVVGGSPVVLYGVAPSFVFDVVGDYVVALTVRDLGGLTGTDWLVVRVADGTPPVADAGADFTAELGVPADFDGTASSDNVGVASWSWTFVCGGLLVALAGPAPAFSFPETGAFNVTLTVSDAAGFASSDVVVVTVVDTVAPAASAGDDIFAGVGVPVVFDGSASSDASSMLNYTWSFIYMNTSVALYGPSPSFVFDEAGTYEVTLTVADPSGNFATDSLSVDVSAPDVVPPTLADATGAGPFPNDAALMLECAASDDRSVDTVSVHYATQVASGNVSMTEGEGGVWRFSLPPASLKPGTVSYEFWAFDGSNWARAGAFERLVYDAVAPVAVAGTDILAVSGTPFILDGSASSDDEGVANHTWHVTGPGVDERLYGAVVSLSIVPSGSFTAQLTVMDDAGNAGVDWLVITVEPFAAVVPYSDGWNLVSLPVCPASGDLPEAFADDWWNVAEAQWYDADAGVWLVYSKNLPAWMNSLRRVDATMGIWVRFDGGDGTLLVSGDVPTSTEIRLSAGWNLVGFPSLDAGRTFAEVLAGTPWDGIQVQDSFTLYIIRDALPSETAVPGAGFWVHVTADAVVTVPW